MKGIMMTSVSNNRAMQWVNALSTRPSLEAAVAEVVQRAQEALNYAPVDLGLIFISAAFASEYSRLMPLLEEKLPGVPLIGCSGGGVVGMGHGGDVREIEDEAALSLTLASLPGVKVQAFHLEAEDLPDLDAPPHAWVDVVGADPAAAPQFILLADPFTSRLNDLLQGLDFAYGGAAKVGGLASTGRAGSHQTSLFCNYRLYREGAVGVALSGEIVLETIVAQGCRPIGAPFQVRESERNILVALEPQAVNEVGEVCTIASSHTPLQLLQELVQELDESDRQLAQTSLFVGIAQSEFKLKLDPGDFLIRQLIGVDPKTGALAIGDRVRPGQRIQFHLRDAKASALDLETLLKYHRNQSLGRSAPMGALLFSCLGRGESLYNQPDFDSTLFREYVNVPVGGFFCNGEIGPVGTSTFLHGFTSVFGIFRQP
jgi:small ligand-binding sensory domain FIST